jgi:hypothetical protein
MERGGVWFCAWGEDLHDRVHVSGVERLIHRDREGMDLLGRAGWEVHGQGCDQER